MIHPSTYRVTAPELSHGATYEVAMSPRQAVRQLFPASTIADLDPWRPAIHRFGIAGDRHTGFIAQAERIRPHREMATCDTLHYHCRQPLWVPDPEDRAEQMLGFRTCGQSHATPDGWMCYDTHGSMMVQCGTC